MTSSERRFFIHATNVHTGGGRALLNGLLSSLPTNVGIVALLDARMETVDGVAQNLVVKRVKPSIWQRLKAEWWLARNVSENDFVLCFGNLPPLFQSQGHIVVFVQNRYLIDQISRANFPLKTRLRLKVERFWFFWKASNAHAFVVQTPSMQNILRSSSRLGGKPVLLLPFVKARQGYQRTLAHSKHEEVAHDFIYVASGEPHKNHRRLIEAWCLLANDNLFPSLWLTLDPQAQPDLCAWIDQQKSRLGLRLENFGVQSHEEIQRLYTQVQALIYPSTFESFGLPLIEARQAGLAVVASELDFVRDVLDPEQSFDPESAVSIARAVKRFMGKEEAPLPLQDAAEFIRHVIGKAE